MHCQTQLAETQFAYKLMRCMLIFIEQPELKYACWQFYSLLFSHTFFLLLLSFLSPSRTVTFLSSLSYSFTPSSLQSEPRPSGILYQWTWSSQQSSGRRSTRRKRRRTGQWRRLFKDWRMSWTAGGAVILAKDTKISSDREEVWKWLPSHFYIISVFCTYTFYTVCLHIHNSHLESAESRKHSQIVLDEKSPSSSCFSYRGRVLTNSTEIFNSLIA